MKRTAKWAAIVLAAIIVLVVAALIAYLYLNPSAQPDQTALAALESNGTVVVTHDPWLTFAPTDTTPTTGFILYPGGRVDPRAYAPVARDIAAAGYLVVIPHMPLDLAVLGVDRADRIIAAHPQITSWAVGGHSLGGISAAQYAARRPDFISGLALWAAYLPGSVDLSDSDLAVVSIFGTEDGLISQQEIDGSRRQLPPSTLYAPIQGGNHAQFGSYGTQDGDRPASISADEQRMQTAEYAVGLLRSIVRSTGP